jgi:hypothetical protein
MYDFHDEVYYVVRRSDGRPLAVPAWRTHPEAACAKVVSAARLPVRVLLELCRVTVTGLSSCVHNVHEENHDAAPRKMPTTTIRRTARRSRRTTPTGRAKTVCNKPGCSGNASSRRRAQRRSSIIRTSGEVLVDTETVRSPKPWASKVRNGPDGEAAQLAIVAHLTLFLSPAGWPIPNRRRDQDAIQLFPRRRPRSRPA